MVLLVTFFFFFTVIKYLSNLWIYVHCTLNTVCSRRNIVLHLLIFLLNKKKKQRAYQHVHILYVAIIIYFRVWANSRGINTQLRVEHIVMQIPSQTINATIQWHFGTVWNVNEKASCRAFRRSPHTRIERAAAAFSFISCLADIRWSSDVGVACYTRVRTYTDRIMCGIRIMHTPTGDISVSILLFDVMVFVCTHTYGHMLLSCYNVLPFRHGRRRRGRRRATLRSFTVNRG